MTNQYPTPEMIKTAKKVHRLEGGLLAFWCPACDEEHHIQIEGDAAWSWDGNEASPTFSPSVLVKGKRWPTDEEHKRIMNGETIELDQTSCHSFVRNGQIEYLSDCTHDLAGKIVPMTPWEQGEAG